MESYKTISRFMRESIVLLDLPNEYTFQKVYIPFQFFNAYRSINFFSL